MYSKLFRLCSMILALVMLCNMLPMTTFAESIPISTTDNATEPSNEATQILGEVETLRTATQKHFRMSDGSFLAVNYGIPVHYQDTSGQWQEIDNRLSPEDKGNVYTARNGEAVTAYAADLSTGQILTAAYGDVSVSMGILDQTVTAGQIDMTASAELMTYDRESCAVVTQQEAVESAAFSADNSSQGWTTEDLIPAGLNASVLYEDVFPGIDLQYTAYSHHIKEQIIVKEPQASYRYDFSLSLEGLSPTLNEDGSVTLADEGGEAVYTVPAPFMQDSGGAVSTDVSYTLTETNGGVVLTVTADKDWINAEERVFPVRIDPTIELNIGWSNQDIFAAVAMEANPNETSMNWPELYVGSYRYKPESLRGLYRLFVHFNNLPAIPAGSIVTDAGLRLYMQEVAGTGISAIPMAAYDVTTELPAAYSNHRAWFNAISWRNQPQYDTSNAYDYVIDMTVSDYKTWDLTDAAKSWYFEGSDPTIAIVAEDESILSVEVWRYAKFCAFGSGTPPIFTVTYRSDVGLEDYYSYTSMSAGRAGTGYINNYTGNLVWVRSDMGFGGNRMPVSINHVYNANNASNNLFGLGNGWRTNFHQRVYQWDADSTCYAWEDADGTVHYFYYDETIGKYRDEDGLELTLTVSNGYTIEDKYGNKSYFDTAGRLYKQENNQATKSSISITYTDGTNSYISTITDGAGRVYSFEYSSNNLLEKISYKGSGSSGLYYTTYEYSNDDLTKVTDKDGEYTTYTYSNHLLTSATDIDGYTLSYGYLTTAGGQNSRVVSVNESDGSASGGSLTIEYAHNQTTFTDVSGNVQIMQFNNWGNTISVQDGEGRAQYAQYGRTALNPNNDAKGNQLTLSSKLQNTVGNHVRDSSFENGEGLFSNTIPGEVSVWTAYDQAYHGSKSIRVTRQGNVTGEAGVYYFVTAQPGETYTFSAYVKTESNYAVLMLEEHVSSSQVVYHRGESLPANSDWTRLEMSYTNTATAGARSVALMVLGGSTGEFYIDCVQFEKSPTASRYNLVENGDFRYSLNGWTYQNFVSADGIYTHTAAAPELEETVVGITGDPLKAKYLTQTVNVSGDDGDWYVLSGWAKGDSIPIKDSRQFAIIGTFHYTDGGTGEFKAQFNPDTDSDAHWQYSSAAMVAEKAYSSITVTVAYDYNVNTVYFDGIQLFKEEFGNSYTYENGNVTSVKDLQGQTTTYEYENNNLTKQLHPSGVGMRYEYDEWHNVTAAIEIVKNEDGEEIDGIVYNFTYDTYGNNTSVSVGNGITTTATYINSGNTLHQTTDALGNVTEYSYNADTNVLEWVKYPKDTDTTKTSYTYDDMYRMATATATTDTNTALTASYTYTDDLLTEIKTHSTTYSFNYGNFALRSNVKIGNRTLASYSYTDRTNYLASLDYGNGDKVQYEYDKQGRVVSQTYEDGDTVTYRYDNSGALATVTDSATGITTTYYYDFTDRLMKHVESGSDYSHSVGYEYDNINNLTALVETINGVKHTTAYTYDNDNRVSSITNGSVSEAYTYDAYSRVGTKVAKNGSTTVLTDTFTYRAPTSTSTAGQVASLKSAASGYNVTYNYTYDDNGNILSVSTGSNNTTSYVYDSANQLTRENNQAAGKTWVWTYDDAGNITSRKEYAYTTGSLGSVLSTVNYTYGDSSWGDLLTGWNGKTITSDTIGNMTSDGTWSYTWEHGRELVSMSNGSTTWTYTYNADGLRTKRTNGSSTYSYVYNGSSLSQMTVGSNTLYFAYDASGTPLSVTYNGTNYYYATNLQGDVTAILNTSGTAVVQYTYDAWGNILTTTGSMASDLGAYNPLRYRGYVYDAETQLYYLQSRYYNPAMGRFINGDEVTNLGADDGLTSFNLFTYCTNNPVNRFDENGNWSLPNWAKIVIGVGIIAAAAAITVATGGAAAGTLVAAVHCAAQGALVGAVTQGAIGAVTGGISGAVTHRLTTGSWSGAANAAIDGAASGFMTGTITGAISGAISSPYCFVAGTTVLTAAGVAAIETIQKGDRVWAWDEETGDVTLKEVVETYVNETDELVHVFVNGDEIIATPAHPFYSPVKGWTDAVHLRAGDILVLVNGEYVVVEKVQHEILEEPVTVYNFQVVDYHTYYVASGVLVHNKCGMNNNEATAAAKKLGYTKVKGTSVHGNAVFTNSKASRALRYITADADVHSGGVWKAAKSIADLGSKATRSGTYNALLEWIAP